MAIRAGYTINRIRLRTGLPDNEMYVLEFNSFECRYEEIATYIIPVIGLLVRELSIIRAYRANIQYVVTNESLEIIILIVSNP